MRFWFREWLRVGAVISIAGGLLWLLMERDVGQAALLRSTLWALVVWVVSTVVWVGLQYGQWHEADRLMRHRGFAPAFFGMVLVALVAGCAGPSAGPFMPTPAASSSDLTGTWNGVFWWLGGTYWEDEGTLLLQIKEDRTFTVTMTPTAAANNIAKVSRWSGTVSQSGRRVVFHLSKGTWPAWSSLTRSGDTMYGVADDPATGADVQISFERGGRGA